MELKVQIEKEKKEKAELIEKFNEMHKQMQDMEIELLVYKHQMQESSRQSLNDLVADLEEAIEKELLEEDTQKQMLAANSKSFPHQNQEEQAHANDNSKPIDKKNQEEMNEESSKLQQILEKIYSRFNNLNLTDSKIFEALDMLHKMSS